MHMENMVMGIAFGTAVTVFRNGHLSDYKELIIILNMRISKMIFPKHFQSQKIDLLK